MDTRAYAEGGVPKRGDVILFTNATASVSCNTGLASRRPGIAGLVGEGNSNEEVAAQLFLSPRTVEYHLRRVFAKLGISSRAELIRLGVAAREPAMAS